MATDRRVQRTCKLLRESLMSLILEKEYESITVQDITDRANLGRATLYLHYHDKEDLLITSLEEIFDELKALIQPVSFKDMLPTSENPAILITFRHAAENANLYRVLLSGQGTVSVFFRVRDYLTRVLKEVVTASLQIEDETTTIEVASNFISGAIVMIIEWWLRHDIPYPTEQMAKIVGRMITTSMYSVIMDDSFSDL